MANVMFEISMSLDGYVAGPDATLEDPLGKRGEELHEWIIGLDAWRERHGLEGGERSVDSEVVEESLALTGAVVMGRKMYSGSEGPWEDDPNADGWWGDDPPFRVPVFVLTHHPREPETKKDTAITFVTDGIASAVAQARDSAGDKSVVVAGGGSVIQQSLGAGLVDECRLHVAPILLGGGVRLFDNVDADRLAFEPISAVHSPAVSHLRYRVVRR